MATNENTTSISAQRRERREQLVTAHLERLTGVLRALASGEQSLDFARRIRDRYARAIGVPAGAGGDAFIAFLRSTDALEHGIENIDDMMNALAQASHSAEFLAAMAILQAKAH